MLRAAMARLNLESCDYMPADEKAIMIDSLIGQELPYEEPIIRRRDDWRDTEILVGCSMDNWKL